MPFRVKILIAPKDNKFPVLQINEPLSYLEEIPGKSTKFIGAPIKKDNLKAFDEDTKPNEITYHIKRPPLYGYLALTHRESKTVQPVTSFTQQQINNKMVYFILKDNKVKSVTSDSFTFDIVDSGSNTIPDNTFNVAWSYVSFTKEQFIVDENEEKYLTVTLKRRGDTSRQVFVYMDLFNKTARTNLDVAHKIDSQVAFARGKEEAIWRVKLKDDKIYEGREEITVGISRPMEVLLERPKRASVIITDENDRAKMFFKKSKMSVAEDIKMANVTIYRTGDLSKISSVVCYTEDLMPEELAEISKKQEFSLATGTGPSPLRSFNDYITRPRKFSSTIQFLENETEKTCSVQIIDDSLYESRPEAFNIKLADPWTGIVDKEQSNKVQVTIKQDNNDIPEFYLKQDEYLVDESSTYLEVEVWRNGADLEKSSSVIIATSQLKVLPKIYQNASTPIGLAQVGIDYIGKNEQLTFAKNETMKRVQIRIIDDWDDVRLEGREVFQISLMNPVHANLGKRFLSYVIIDDSVSDRPTMGLGVVFTFFFRFIFSVVKPKIKIKTTSLPCNSPNPNKTSPKPKPWKEPSTKPKSAAPAT